MTRKIRRWLADRASTIRALQQDVQALEVDKETLEQLLSRMAASERKLKVIVEEQAGVIREYRQENALLEATVTQERLNRAAVEKDLASLRDRLGEHRQRIEKAQLAGDAA